MTVSKATNSFFLTLLVLSCFETLSFAQYLGAGFCPRLYGIRNFNVTQYQGMWYEVEKYWFLPEASSVCISMYVTSKHDGTFLSEFTSYEQLSMKKMRMPAVNSYKDGNATALFNMKLFVTDSHFPIGITIPWAIIDTDYRTYAIHYFCRALGAINLQGLWIMSRRRTLDEDIREHLYNKLAYLGLDTASLKMTDQTACPP